MREWGEGGWLAALAPTHLGGQQLPFLIWSACRFVFAAANYSASVYGSVTGGVAHLIETFGTEEMAKTYIPNLFAGKWQGTMALTEPQAGSDLGALTTKAVRADDDSYRITGNKIFVTWGEHDLAENIIHLVLARTPDSPPGTKGISCFIVPKFIPNPDGSLGDRNDITCVSLEHKLGIHASPTCVLSFGDQGGAVGYLIEEENQGLKAMFTMMNNARLHVGMEGLAVAERSFRNPSPMRRSANRAGRSASQKPN